MSTRGSIRRKYGIESSGVNDCLLSCCCGCCTLIQEDKEIKSHEQEPMVQTGYAAPNGGQQMMYGQPQGTQPGQKIGVQ